MKQVKPIYLGFLLLLFACGGDGEEMVNDEMDNSENSSDLEDFLLVNSILPVTGEKVDVQAISSDPDIAPVKPLEIEPIVLQADGSSMVTLPLGGSAGNITHAALRVGSTSQLEVINIEQYLSLTSDTLFLPLVRPDGFCDEFLNTCQEIVGELFIGQANDDGSFNLSQGSTITMSAICGGCTEPSCVSIVGINCWTEEDNPNPSRYTFNGEETIGGNCDIGLATSQALGFYSVIRGQSGLDPGVVVSNAPSSGRFQLPFPNYLQDQTLTPVLTIQLNADELYYGVSGTLSFTPTQVTFDVMVERASTMFDENAEHVRLPLKGKITCTD